MSAPATRPTVALPVALAMATDAKAPASIIASTEMFRVPARSARYSPQAAKASGAVSRSALDRMVPPSSGLMTRAALPSTVGYRRTSAPGRSHTPAPAAPGRRPPGRWAPRWRPGSRPRTQRAEQHGDRERDHRPVAGDEGDEQAVPADVVGHRRLEPEHRALDNHRAGEPGEGAGEHQRHRPARATRMPACWAAKGLRPRMLSRKPQRLRASTTATITARTRPMTGPR